MTLESYFKSEDQIRMDFKKAFSLLEKGKEKNAFKLFEENFLHAPYQAEVHFELAKYFAEKKNNLLAIYHLEVCFDLDEVWLEKAKKDQIISKNIEAEQLAKVEEDKLSRWWQVIRVDQIEPAYKSYSVDLKIRPKNLDAVQHFYDHLHERVTHYFRIVKDKPEKDFGDNLFQINDHLSLEGDVDRTYCGYGKLYAALKKLSPHLEDVHFFMSSESMFWLDEIRIKEGEFYFYRHDTNSDYSRDRLEVVAKLSKNNPENTFLNIYLSEEFTEMAEFNIDELGQNRSTDEDEKAIAQAYLKKAFKSNPKNPETHYQQSRYFEKLGQIEKAKASLLKTLNYSPFHFLALYDLGQYFMLKKDYREAIKYFKKAEKINSGYNKIHFLTGKAYELAGDNAKAKEEYKKDIEGTEKHNAKDLVRWGNSLVEEKLYASALLYFEGSLKKNKLYIKDLEVRRKKNASATSQSFYEDQIKSAQESIANAYTGISLIEVEFKSDAKAAFATLEKALEANPDSVDALYNTGTLLTQTGRSLEAEKYFDLALSRDQKHLNSLNNKIFILFGRGDWNKVIEYGQRILALTKNYPNVYVALGGAYINLKNHEEALKIYLKGLEVDPTSEKCWQGAGLAYGWLGRYEKSIEYNKKALKLNPKNEGVLSDVASALNNLGKYDEALKYANKAITLNPSYYHPYYVKACIFALTGKIKEAEDMIKKVLEVDPARRVELQNEADFKKIINVASIQKILF